jgi:hypothetical protein
MAVIYDEEADKYYGVAEEARRLNVSFTQLSEVLKGNRISKRLTSRVEIKVAKRQEVKG